MPRSTAASGRTLFATQPRFAWATLAAASLVALSALMTQPAHAAAPRDTVIEAVQLPAWVEHNGQRQPAQPGQRLRVNDTVVTANASRILLRMPDRSVIKLGEKTEFKIEALASKQQSAAGPTHMQSALRLITGVFRYATDYTSKALGNTRDINLSVATATVGIRGTDFWAMSDTEHDAVCLFEGHVAVQRGQREDIHLDKPGAFWTVRTNEAETPKGIATPDQLAKFINQAELQPGSGILLEGGRWRAVAGLLPSGNAAAALRERLQGAGYPTDVRMKRERYEVRINNFATEADAQAVLQRLQADTSLGLSEGGRVTLAAE